MNKCKILAKVNLGLMISLIFVVLTFGVIVACLYLYIGANNKFPADYPNKSLDADLANIKDIKKVYWEYIMDLLLFWDYSQ